MALRTVIGERQSSSYFLLMTFREDFESWENREISHWMALTVDEEPRPYKGGWPKLVSARRKNWY